METADVASIQNLITARQDFIEQGDDPVSPFPYMAYHAIDQALHLLEYRAEAKDLKTLEALYPTLPEDAVHDRVEWTLMALRHRFKPDQKPAHPAKK